MPFIGDITEHPCFQEQYGFRNNTNQKDTKTGLYVKDLNGDQLDELNQAMLDEFGIVLEIERGDVEEEEGN